MSTIFQALVGILHSVAIMLPSALSAPPQTDPPHLRVGLGGDIPVAPILLMILLVASGFAISAATGIRGFVFLDIVPEKYYIPSRVLSTLAVALVAAHAKHSCDAALEKAGTKATFDPVPAIADTGPYKKCRNPMYWAILSLPAAIGLAADNAWVVFGSNFILWLYLHFMVVPAEEKFLQMQLGDSYKKYCVSVKRWGFF